MKSGVIADVHLSRYSNDKIEDTSNLPERLHSIKNSLDHFISYCRENKIDIIHILGDLLHGKSIIYAIAQSIMLDFFRNNQDMKFIVIDGNHDLSGKGSDVVSALRCLDYEPNVFRVKENFYRDEENDILYVPYSYDMVDIIKNNSAKYLMSHFGLSEGVLNSGISVVTDIKAKDLIGKYKHVYLGHYHAPQQMINENIEIYYVGSLIQLDHGEKNEEKRFLVIDTDKETTTNIPSKGYKKFIEYVITSENKDEIIKQARKEKEEGHHVNIVKRDSEINTKDIESEFKIVDKTEKDITNRGISSNMSEEDRMKKYLEIQGINPEEINEYLNESIDIVNSCRGVEE